MWCDFPQRTHNSKSGRANFLQQQSQQSWLDQVKSIGVIDTAEGFWGIHDCTLPPSKLPNGSNYYLFRNNIAPMWEHEANRRGGKWVAHYTAEQASECNQGWTDLCVAMIGEQIPSPEEEVCGAMVSKRKSGLKLSLWTRTAANKPVQTNIGFFLKVLLGFGRPGGAMNQGSLCYLQHNMSLDAALKSCARSPTGHEHSKENCSPVSPTTAAVEGLRSPVGSSPPSSIQLSTPLYTI
jgi:translation initiation factor 4E